VKKNILKVYRGSYIASVWVPIILTLSTLVVFFVLYDSSRDSLWTIVLSSIILFSALTYMIIYALYLIQRAEISEDGITIYSVIFSTIKVIKWNELYDVRTESIITFSSANGYSSSRDWIVLYTDQSQKERMWGAGIYNRKKKGPWYIACTKENITVMTEYIIKYATHICDDPDVFF
jgi:hypothetical protein